MADPSSMSAKELKALIASAGLMFNDCFEKSEFIARAKEAQTVLEAGGGVPAAKAEGGGSRGGGCSAVKVGGYDCLVIGPEDPDLVVVILHGYGATNNDFRDIPKVMESMGKKIKYYLPQAPTNAAGMTEWWTINVMEWAMAMQQRTAGNEKPVGNLIRKEPPGLAECRKKLTIFLEEVCAGSKVDHSKVMLCGFSQGAMTALDLALTLPKEKAVAGVTVISGSTIVVEQWTQRLKEHPGLKVLITHGQSDMVLPCIASGWLNDLLRNGGAEVKYELHGGGHDLGGPNIMKKIAEHWASVM